MSPPPLARSFRQGAIRSILERQIRELPFKILAQMCRALVASRAIRFQEFADDRIHCRGDGAI